MPPRRSAASSALLKIKQSYEEPELYQEVEASPRKPRKTTTRKPKPTATPRKVTGFLDLPEDVRKKIYRIVLVSEDVIEYARFVWHSNETALVRVSKEIAAEAAPIYFAENHFHFNSCLGVGLFFLQISTSHARMIQKISFEWTLYRATWAMERLRKATQLTELKIGIDEDSLVRDFLKTERDVRTTSGPITPQMNLRVLLIPGMDALRRLNNIKHVRFQARGEDGWRDGKSGPIPDGVLTRIVAAELMGSLRPFEERDGSFPFLKLPAELRNRIYRRALTIDGPISPSKRSPTSARLSGWGSKRGRRNNKPFPYSVLSLLQVNRQLYEEAVGLFYHINHFEFYYFLQFVLFLNEIRDKRRASIREVTFWYRVAVDGPFDTSEAAFTMLESLPSLRHVHVNCESIAMGFEHSPAFKILARLRGSVEITIRDFELERDLRTLKGKQHQVVVETRKRDRQLKALVKKLNDTVNGTDEKPTAQGLIDLTD